MLAYTIDAALVPAAGGTASAHGATISLDTTLAGRPDAMNPVELLLAGLASCMLKGIERAAPMLGFSYRAATITVHATRQDSPPRLVSITYELTIDTDEPDRRLELLHLNVIKYGTISNTLGPAVAISGTVSRA